MQWSLYSIRGSDGIWICAADMLAQEITCRRVSTMYPMYLICSPSPYAGYQDKKYEYTCLALQFLGVEICGYASSTFIQLCHELVNKLIWQHSWEHMWIPRPRVGLILYIREEIPPCSKGTLKVTVVDRTPFKRIYARSTSHISTLGTKLRNVPWR